MTGWLTFGDDVDLLALDLLFFSFSFFIIIIIPIIYFGRDLELHACNDSIIFVILLLALFSYFN